MNAQEVSFDEALSQARAWTHQATQTLITGDVLSVETARAALELARSVSAVVDTQSISSAFDWIEAVQSEGCFMATMDEVRYRADAIVLIDADDILQRHPRLIECLKSESTKTIYAIRTESDRDSQSTSNDYHHSSQVNQQELFTNLKRLSWGKSCERAELASILAAIEANSSYVAFVVSTAKHWDAGSDLYRALNRYVLRLNQTKKAVVVPLASLGAAFSQVALWQTGFASRFQYRDGIAAYDPLSLNKTYIEERSSKGSLFIFIDESFDAAKIRLRFHSGVAIEEVILPIASANVTSQHDMHDALTHKVTLLKADGSLLLPLAMIDVNRTAAQILSLLCE
jgi:formylmethanofuran dehydrogenase subunit B